jgi:Flp pilus assembly protein protease CpaA
MLFEQILVGTALLGSTIAAIYDLKTTEVPDWVFYAMLAVGLPAVTLQALLQQNIEPFVSSLLSGGAMLALGFLMYKVGQWGGADAALLALFGFLLPKAPAGFPAKIIFPFPISLLFNIFVIGAVYMILYAIAYSFKHLEILKKFSLELKASARIIAFASLVLLAIFAALTWQISRTFGFDLTVYEFLRNVLAPLALTIAIFIIFKFARSVENFGFRKRIPISKLQVGDMLLKTRELVGITQSKIKELKKSGRKYVWIKEGVRFAPTFPIALLYTLYFGDAIFLLHIFF